MSEEESQTRTRKSWLKWNGKDWMPFERPRREGLPNMQRWSRKERA